MEGGLSEGGRERNSRGRLKREIKGRKYKREEGGRE